MNSKSSLILAEALKYVPRYGFSNKTFLEALKNLDIPANSVLQLFPRGFAAALTEYIVKSSNFETQKQLEEKFSKDTFLNTIAENRDSFLQNQLRVPTITDVVEAALMVKVNYLTPFVDKWAEAVSCEISPSNLPYTIINLAEFADIAAYHMERVEQLHRLKPVLQIFANVQSTREKPKEQFLEAIRESIRGIPLSSGPHVGGLLGQLAWSCRRAQIAVAYGTSMASLMGDRSSYHSDTRALVKELSKTVF